MVEIIGINMNSYGETTFSAEFDDPNVAVAWMKGNERHVREAHLDDVRFTGDPTKMEAEIGRWRASAGELAFVEGNIDLARVLIKGEQ